MSTEPVRPFLTVVIPSYRGVHRIPTLLEELEATLPAIPAGAGTGRGRLIEILVVEDGSPEEEQHRLRDLVAGRNGALRQSRATVAFDYQTICLPRNRGQQYATIAGISLARGELIATVDDDGGHPPTVLVEMVRTMIDDPRINLLYAAPIADSTASRPWTRRVGTFFNNALFYLFAGKPFDVPVTSFRVIRRDLVQRALTLPVRYAYLSAMLFACHPRVAAHRYIPVAAGDGGSRYSLSRLASIFWNLLLYWGPLRPIGRFLRPPRPLDLPRGCD
ncbi:MAG: glycosyltransferase family 2 protein [Alkalispirochaeta sp.]